jgi:alpha-glucosidase
MPSTPERIPSTSSWDGSVVYQIYPRTFNEARADGEVWTGQGNLRGIMEKRDYLDDLGVNAIWISPFYPSPMIDGGYDISDYTDIDPQLGLLGEFVTLTETFHEREIKNMIDLVPNHTSDQHPWFKESRLSRDNPRSDWYIWHDGAPDGGVPNNWSSVFSFPNLRARERDELIVPDGENTPPVSAWQWDKTRQQYYLRDFDASQPNLNWANPEVREAMLGVIRTWIERGVDGIRVDVANHLGKNTDFTDEEPDPNYREGIDNPHDQHVFYNSLNYWPTLQGYLEVLTGVLREYPEKDLFEILECWMSEKDLRKVDGVAPHVASSFNFTRLKAPWDAQIHRKLLENYHANLPDGSIPNQVLSNHDVPRVATRLGMAAARSAAVLNLSLPGMIFIYNGEEGGFTDVDVAADRRRDDGLGERDAARTPMLWNGSRNAGFSQADETDLWLPVDPEYEIKNLEAQAKDPASSFSLYRKAIGLRNENKVLKNGSFPLWLDADHPDVLAFTRHYDDEEALTLVNFSDRPVTHRLRATQRFIGKVVISSVSSHPDQIIDTDKPISLQPNEAIVATKIAA